MASESLHPASAPSRRTVVAAVGAAGIAITLNACSSDDGASSSSGASLAKTSDIPEGGGKIFKDEGVVVTQPTAGEFKAFSSKCTHQGCAVTGVTNGVITCPCHKSEFSVTDGSVKKGPATQALPEEKITVNGDSIALA
ncbi:Rieske (2Fe-2S) protein [Streptomyces fulvoviolaceus]|uniref:Rieske (2Fe-2S) protein n=1 Tax=Streptomyces fulvoviolaceus TaxID=285535 RepID=UPI0004CA6ACF|nr:Rieske (2Fe-2S) protein [Streptomyces fulvoviolaceus]MCT9080233.1 Rieske (2Fe-2S) protein [Streptomyces fulvoviolaceus]